MEDREEVGRQPRGVHDEGDMFQLLHFRAGKEEK